MAKARAGGTPRLDVVRAAGGVVHRLGDDGEVEVLLVHRPRYDDWSFPKGKADGDEPDKDCALREVEEETGLRCELEEELASTRYHDRLGRPKVVRYWAMRPLRGRFEPHREIDEVRWFGRAEADAALTWPRDREVLRSFHR